MKNIIIILVTLATVSYGVSVFINHEKRIKELEEKLIVLSEKDDNYYVVHNGNKVRIEEVIAIDMLERGLLKKTEQ